MSDQELLLAKEAAEILRVDRSTLWRYQQQGLITYVRLGDSSIRYRRSDIDAFIAAGVRPAVASVASPGSK